MPFLLMYWKYIAAVALVAAAVTGIWANGYSYADNKAKVALFELLEEARVLARENTLLLEQVSINEAALALKARVETRIVKDTIVKWKVKYVQTEVAGKCDIPIEFVRVHDAAASNRMPEATDSRAESDGAARGLTDIDLLDVTTANYAMCHKWADQLRHWQARERGLQNATNTN